MRLRNPELFHEWMGTLPIDVAVKHGSDMFEDGEQAAILATLRPESQREAVVWLLSQPKGAMREVYGGQDDYPSLVERWHEGWPESPLTLDLWHGGSDVLSCAGEYRLWWKAAGPGAGMGG